jgi:hypothetical protein
MRIATPSLQWTCTTYSLPVSTGAPKFKIFAKKARPKPGSLHKRAVFPAVAGNLPGPRLVQAPKA